MPIQRLHKKGEILKREKKSRRITGNLFLSSSIMENKEMRKSKWKSKENKKMVRPQANDEEPEPGNGRPLLSRGEPRGQATPSPRIAKSKKK